MTNPWEEISLDDYEKHMSLESVRQLQALDSIMKEQFAAYPVETAAVLGIAGGNGLEHIDTDKYRRVYGVDINADYLRAASQRYTQLSGVLECLHIDLINEAEKLPQAQLLIANLLIEYKSIHGFRGPDSWIIVRAGKSIHSFRESAGRSCRWPDFSPVIRGSTGRNCRCADFVSAGKEN